MTMFQVLIVSHGDLAKAMLESAEMICGVQADVTTFGLYPGDSPDGLREDIENTLCRLSGQDRLVLTDIRSGTPFNVVAGLMSQYGFRHISGINLAMLIEILMSRDEMTADEAADEVLKISSQTILDVNTLL